MLAELRMKLETEHTNFGYYQLSNMQGFSMERIDSSYAQKELFEEFYSDTYCFIFAGITDRENIWDILLKYIS